MFKKIKEADENFQCTLASVSLSTLSSADRSWFKRKKEKNGEERQEISLLHYKLMLLFEYYTLWEGQKINDKKGERGFS